MEKKQGWNLDMWKAKIEKRAKVNINIKVMEKEQGGILNLEGKDRKEGKGESLYKGGGKEDKGGILIEREEGKIFK